MIISKKNFNLLKFDSRLTGWHAYGADYCLSVQRLSLKAYAVPTFIWHDSPTQNLEGLDDAHRYLWAKYRSFHDKVVTTVAVLPDKWDIYDDYRGWKKTIRCWIPNSVKKIPGYFSHQLFRRPLYDLPSYIHNNLLGHSVDVLFAIEFEYLAECGLPKKIVSNSFKPFGYSRSFLINNHFVYKKEQLKAYDASPDVIILTHGIIDKFKNAVSDIVCILQKASNQIWIIPEPDQKQYSHIDEYLRLFSQYDWHIKRIWIRSVLKMTTQYIAFSFIGR